MLPGFKIRLFTVLTLKREVTLRRLEDNSREQVRRQTDLGVRTAALCLFLVVSLSEV